MRPTSSNLHRTMGAYEKHAEQYAVDNAELMGAELSTFLEPLPAGARILDAGCGPGRDLARMRAAGYNASGVDMSPAFVTLARSTGAPVVIGDLAELPFSASAFCAVWACASLVHLDTATAHLALQELARVTRPGGRLFLSVKSDDSGRAAGWQDTAHGERWFSYWSQADLATAVADAGWTPTTSQTSGQFINLSATL